MMDCIIYINKNLNYIIYRIYQENVFYKELNKVKHALVLYCNCLFKQNKNLNERKSKTYNAKESFSLFLGFLIYRCIMRIIYAR